MSAAQAPPAGEQASYAPPSEAFSAPAYGAAPPFGAVSAPVAARSEPQTSNAPEEQTAPAESAQRLVYRARLSIAVFDASEMLDSADAMTRGLGGYLLRRSDSEVVLRVPAPRFHEALAELAKLGELLHQEVQADDVSAEYRDLETRLKNALAVRDRLEELLAKADGVSASLEVEHELERITQEIERMRGRLRLLSELVAYSTITVSASQKRVVAETPRATLPFPWLQDLGLHNLMRLEN